MLMFLRSASLLVLLCYSGIYSVHANPEVYWARKAGSTASDRSLSVSTYADGGAVKCGAFQGTATFGGGEPGQKNLSSAGGNDSFVARYNDDGALLWASRAGGTMDDQAIGVRALNGGGAVATGWFMSSAIFGQGEANQKTLGSMGGYDGFLVNYHPDGSLAWAKRIGGSSGPEVGRAVAVMPDNGILACGWFVGTAYFESTDVFQYTLTAQTGGSFLVKYHPTGQVLWAKSIGADEAETIEVKADGSILLAGNFDGQSTFGKGEANETTFNSAVGRDLFIAEYDAEGNLAWVRRAIGASGNVYPQSIAETADQGFLVVGNFSNSVIFGPDEPNETELVATSASDSFVARYDSEGRLLWVKKGLGEIGNKSVVVLENGEFVVGGNFTGFIVLGLGEPRETVLVSAGAEDFFLARYRANGRLIWAARTGGTGVDVLHAMSINQHQDIVLSGWISSTVQFGLNPPHQTTLTSTGNIDSVIAKYLILTNVENSNWSAYE